jgi:O-antigen/teichoic acid export membrane protein
MLRQLIRDSAGYGLAAAAARATSIVLLPVYARLLESREIGTLDVLAVVINIVNVTVALEVAQGLARHYPEAKDPSVQREFASSAFWFTALTYSAFAFIGFVLADSLSTSLLGSSDQAGVVRLAAVAAWLGGLMTVLMNQLRSDLQVGRYVVVSLTYTLTSVGLAIALVAIAHAGVAGVIAGQIVGSLLAVLIGVGATFAAIRTPPRRDRLAEMLRFSVPLVPASLGVLIFLSIDRLVINQQLGLAEVGTFGVGYRVAQSMSLLSIGFQLALTPLLYRRYEEPETPRDLARVFRYYVAAAIIAWTVVSVFSGELIHVFATSAYDRSATVVAPLAAAVLFSNLFIFAPGLAIAKRTTESAALNIAAGVANTALNVILIPRLGIAGAALATLISAIGLFAGYMVFSQRTYPVPHRWAALAAATGVSAVGVIAWTLIAPTGLAAQLVRLLIVAIAPASVIALGLTPLRELASLPSRLRGRPAA